LLTITDGTLKESVTLFGQYIAAGFNSASDGHGGTDITYGKPPALAQEIAPHPS
jgi:hypothetical protein